MVASTPSQQAQPKSVFEGLPQETCDFYLKAMEVLDSAGVPYLVGGAYALAYYSGIVRHTKDFDTFLRPRDVQRALDAFNEAGFRTEVTHPHWVAKAFSHAQKDPDFVDLIYSSGNGITNVDDAWFENAVEGEVFGRPVRLCPVEESIWSKSFVMERDRFDGADVAHLLRARGEQLDWSRLIGRYRSLGHERLLLSHLVLFGFIFPSDKSRVPEWVIDELIGSIRKEPRATEKICRGTLLSWSQYLPDLEAGYRDARLRPSGGTMTPAQVEQWTTAEK